MQDNDEKNPSPLTPSENINEELSGALFSKVEIKRMMKAFVTAYLNDDIQILYPDAEELVRQAKYRNEKLDKAEAQHRETVNKIEFNNLISISSGYTGATSIQQETAIFKLWQYVLDAKSGDRIKGKFLEYQFEDRLKCVEDDINELNNRFETLYLYVRTRIPDSNIPQR